jgi:hypothetical protein
MIDPKRFAEEFTEAEHALQILAHTESDDDVFQAALEAFKTTWISVGVDYNLDAPRHRPKKWEKRLKQIWRRALFRVETYSTPDGSLVFAMELGDKRDQLSGYTVIDCRVWFAEELELTRVIAWEVSCHVCRMTGKANGGTCPECSGGGWIQFGVEPRRPPSDVTRDSVEILAQATAPSMTEANARP